MSSPCKGLLVEYSKCSSIHGIRYIFEVHRPLYEKALWIVLVVLSLYSSSTQIWQAYLKWINSPVLIAFDERLVPVHRIPFPTVTICPEIKMETERFDFAQISQQVWLEIEDNSRFNNLINITDEELKNFMATLQICEPEVLDKFAPFLVHDLGANVATTLVDLAVRHNDTLLYAKWNNRFYTSSSIFKYVLTEEGVCHQFNGLNTSDIYRDYRNLNYYDDSVIDYNNFSSNHPRLNGIRGSWSLEDGYVGQGFNSYPQRSVLSSAHNGLHAALIGLKSNFDYFCRSYKQGYKVYINSPESAALTSGNYIHVRHDHEVLISLLPQYITSAWSLHNINPEKRLCYFNNERHLRYFKSYSENNCQIECLTNFTISHCGCARFWMPKPQHVPVCGLTDAACFTSLILNAKAKEMCDCKASCNSLDYDLEITSSRYDFEKTVSAQRDKYEHPGGHGARLSIYFKEPQFTAIKRSEVYTLTTYIATCGGILGLFLGVSILSIVELFYFFTMRFLRIIYNSRMDSKKFNALHH